MSGARAIELDVTGVQNAIKSIGYRVKGFPMSVIAVRLLTEVSDLIESEGGGEWEPLSPNTLKRRPRRIGGKLLQDRGILANMQPSSGSNWAQATSPATYGGYHVTGTKWMPKRDFTGINLSRFLEMAADDILQEVI